MEYDFHRQLGWMDFQNLARNVIQIREGILFESFKEGKDGGIDGRFCSEEGTVILQAKRYGEYKALKKGLKEETKNVEKLRPKRYILVVSIPLTVRQKSELIQLFQKYIKQPGDLVSSDDLNNYLGHPRYTDVVRNYPKLWSAGGAVLQELMRGAINSSVVEESRRQFALAKEARETFVATRIYHDAMDMLEKQSCVVISGQPGAGKSTLARIMALYYIEVMHFEEFVWTTSSVEKLMDMYVSERKQVFVADDIWGQVFYAEKKHDQEMSYLEQLLLRVKRDKNKVLIITTREYIYQQATVKYSLIRSTMERHKLICHVDTYTDAEKAGILFSHLNNANLAAKYVWPIYFQTESIVRMPDYNPRIIDLFLQNNDPWNDSPYEFAQQFMESIRNPSAFWEDIFNRLTEEARLLALIAFVSQGEMEPVGMEDLKKAYYHCLEHMKHLPKNTRNYFACISELEKTIVQVDMYYGNSDEKVVRFRTPAAQDFLLKYMRENIGYYGPVFLDGLCYINQLIFLMDADKIYLPDELYEKALHLFIERIDKWEFSWPFEADDNYTAEGEEETKSSELYRCALLLQLHEKRPKLESFKFLESTIKRYRSMLNSDKALAYADMIVYPALVGDCKNIGVVFENEETVVEEYFQRCFLATHYYIMCNFEVEFADAVSRLLQQNKKWLRANLEKIVWKTVDYFETNGMDTQLDIMLEVQMASIFKLLGVRYTQRFYKELNGKLEHHVVMPDSLRARYNKKLQTSRRNEKWEERKKQEREEKIRLHEVIEHELEIILEKDGDWLEEQQQIQAVVRGAFSPTIKKQLLKVIENREPGSIACFLESKSGIDLLEIVLRAVDELPLPERHFLNRLTEFFFSGCSCRPRAMYDVLWQIAEWDSGSSLERDLFVREIVKIAKEEKHLNILEYLQQHGIIRMSERRVHFEQVFPVHLLLVQQILSASEAEEKAALYKNLREEELWSNLAFMSLAIPILAELDTESFHHCYLCPILQEFEKKTVEEKQPFLFLKELKVEFNFSDDDREFLSSCMNPHELVTVLECMDLFFHDELIPEDFTEKLGTLPIVRGFERREDKYLLKIGLLEEQFIKAWGFEDTSASFFTLLEQIKKYLMSTSYKRKISLEVLNL